MEEKAEPTIYAFIDGNNLKYGVRNTFKDKKTGELIYEGWELDYRKFRLYLTNKYNVTKAYLFIGQVPGNEAMYRFLQEAGYILVFKPTMPYRHDDGRSDIKGNVDAENKLLHVLAPNMRYSSLLNKFASKIIRVDKLKSQLELRPN